MIRRFKQLAGDDRGAAVVELALAAPILAAMVIGVADISTAYGKKLELEQAAQRAIEKVAQTTGEGTPEDTIKKEAVCQFNGTNSDGTCKTGPLTTANVTVTYSLTCDGTDTPYTNDCTGTQLEVRYITASINYNWTPTFNFHFGTHSDGTYHLDGSAGVRVQ